MSGRDPTGRLEPGIMARSPKFPRIPTRRRWGPVVSVVTARPRIVGPLAVVFLLASVTYLPEARGGAASGRTFGPPYHYAYLGTPFNGTNVNGNGTVLSNQHGPMFNFRTGKIGFSVHATTGGCSGCEGEALVWQLIDVVLPLPSVRGVSTSVVANTSWAAQAAWNVTWGSCGANTTNLGSCVVLENISFGYFVELVDSTTRTAYHPAAAGATSFTGQLENYTLCRGASPPYPASCRNYLGAPGALRGHAHYAANDSAVFTVPGMNRSHAWILLWQLGIWCDFATVGLLTGAGSSGGFNLATHGNGLWIRSVTVR